MKTKETFEFYPVSVKDCKQIDDLLKEIRSVLLTRSDGVAIEIERDDQFPPLKPKKKRGLITDVHIHTWDIAA
jgi:hypothetical protein